jgi:uncharacterized protein YqeY
MKLQLQINADLKTSMLNKDSATRDLLRVVIGEINRNPNSKEISDNVIITIMKKMRDDAIILNNMNEVKILERYLPTKLSDDALEASIVDIITINGYTTVKDLGKIMSELKIRHGQSFDGADAGRIAKGKLNVK